QYYYRTFASNISGLAFAPTTTPFKTIDPGTMSVSNLTPTLITETSVRLNGEINALDATADVWVYYGRTDGGTDPAAWEQAVPLASVVDAVQTRNHNLSGLDNFYTWHYRFRATNCVSDLWAPNTESFRLLLYGESMKLTFCGHTAGNINNFPVPVRLSNAIPGFDYSQLQSPTGGDLRFFNATQSSELSYEIERWNPGGESVVWVRIPNIANNQSHIFVKWNSLTTNVPTYTLDGSTWAGINFQGVWHLNSTNAPDSTTFGRHGTSFGDPTPVNGAIGRGLDMDGAGDYVNIDGYKGVIGRRQRTISAWVRIAASGPFVTYGNTSNARRWMFNTDGSGRLRIENGGGNEFHNQDIRNNQWRHVAVTYRDVDTMFLNTFNIRDAILYVDGNAAVGGGSSQDVNTGSNQDLRIARDMADGYLNGEIDEVRIADTQRSTAWIRAEYQSMNPANNYICFEKVVTEAYVTNLAATDVSFSNAMANALVGSSNDTIGVALYWNTIDGGTDPGLWTNSMDLGVFTNLALTNMSAALTGLTRGVRYYYTWRATNLFRDTWAQPSTSFITPALVDNEPGAAPDLGSARLNGNLLGGGPAEVVVYWGESDGGTNASAWDNAVVLSNTSNGPVSTVVSGLLFGVPYYYRLYMTNAVAHDWALSTESFKILVQDGGTPELVIGVKRTMAGCSLDVEGLEALCGQCPIVR
ncbi:MAG: DUF2341 domain-containing protein, partial [Verrucomicrobiota bacterium]